MGSGLHEANWSKIGSAEMLEQVLSSCQEAPHRQASKADEKELPLERARENFGFRSVISLIYGIERGFDSDCIEGSCHYVRPLQPLIAFHPTQMRLVLGTLARPFLPPPAKFKGCSFSMRSRMTLPISI